MTIEICALHFSQQSL